jgi:hypothetical protein
MPRVHAVPARAHPWVIRAIRHIPLPYLLTCALIGLALAALNLFIYRPVTRVRVDLPAYFWARFMVSPLFIAYSLAALHYLHRATEEMLSSFRPVVLVTDEEYARLSQRMLTVERRVDVALSLVGMLAASVGFITQFTILRRASFFARFPVVGAIEAGELALMGLCTALFTYVGIARGIGLYRLVRHPLAIDVFDTSNLAPLYYLSLKLTLALVGLVGVPVLMFRGMVVVAPLQIGIYTAGATSALVAFFLPLWGVHQQTAAVRQRELDVLRARLRALYYDLREEETERAHTRDVANEVAALLHYESAIQRMPTWPYQTALIGLQAISPLALPLLSWAAQKYLLPYFEGVLP